MGNQSSSLHQAAAHNDVEKIEWLFTHENANVNDRDKDGWTPLHFASYGGALEATQALLLRGANPAAADKAGRTPLHLASLQGHSTLASLLIGRGAVVDCKDENHMTPLHKAAIKGNAEVGEQLLRLGADANGQVTDGTTPLHLAAWKDHIAFVRLLLSMGARISEVNNRGQTALHEAAESGNTKVVQLLLSMGADPRAQNKDGATAAVLAAKAGHKDVADLLGGPGTAPQGSAPSAPPFQSGGGGSLYPEVYKPSEESAEKQANKAFWDDNLAPTDKEKASNAGFWGDAMGGSSAPAPAPRKPSPYEEAAKEAARNKEFWDKQLAGGVANIPKRSQQWGDRADRAAGAWSDQIDKDTRAQQQQQQDPRKQFEQNVLKQAQGLWNMLQGKGGDNEGERRKQEEIRRAKAAEVDSEWGGAPKARVDPSGGWGGAQAGVPRQEKYDLEPYDDDDYEPEAKPARKGREGYQGAGELQRKLAQLELDVDREQGWIRGGSKTDADEAAMRRQRIKSQEAEIASLKKQLGGGAIGFGGHAGGRGGTHGIPAEFLCPITQEIMHDPVTAGDGYTYERGPIEKWLGAHNTSPMTGGLMPKGGLQANQSLKSSIRQWQS